MISYETPLIATQLSSYTFFIFLDIYLKNLLFNIVAI